MIFLLEVPEFLVGSSGSDSEFLADFIEIWLGMSVSKREERSVGGEEYSGTAMDCTGC